MYFPVCSHVARKPLVCLLAVAAASLFLLTGCGSGSLAKPNHQGFGTGSLSGTYVFSSEGLDSANNTLLAIAGAFTADGKGGISTGTMDLIDPGNTPTTNVGVSITSGSYSIASDGRGQVKLTSALGTVTFEIVLTVNPGGLSTASSHGLITEYDSHGSGSGTIDLQTGVSNLSQLAGPFAFSIAGSDANAFPFAAAGAFTLGAGGTSSAGVEDFNHDLGITANQPLTANATLGSGTAPGSIVLTTSAFGGLTYDFFPIDATHWKVIETDGTEFLAGDVFTQTGASFPAANAKVAFTMGGVSTGGATATGGLMTSTDGVGDFSGTEDSNVAGNVPSPTPFAANLVVVPGEINGRTVVSLAGYIPAPALGGQWVLYPSIGGLLMLEMDTAGVTTGAGFVQSATTFTAGSSVGYGLNLTGSNSLNGGTEVDDVAQFNATSATTNNMTGVLVENDQGATVAPATLSGSYTPDTAPVTGRGTISVTTPGTFLGGLTLEYYVIDGGSALFIDVDSNQAAVGAFELQGTTAVGPLAQHPATNLARPVSRSRAAMPRR